MARYKEYCYCQGKFIPINENKGVSQARSARTSQTSVWVHANFTFVKFIQKQRPKQRPLAHY
jgi:hypothetical protein